MSAKWTFWAWDQQLDKAPLKLTLLQLADNANNDGISWYSTGKMANKCNMSDRALRGHIKTLEIKGLITVKHRAGTSSVYTLIGDAAEVRLNATPADTAALPRQILPHPPADTAALPRQILPTILTVEPNNETNTPAAVPKRDDRELIEAADKSFAIWWEAYPTSKAHKRRVAKDKCASKWLSLCRQVYDRAAPEPEQRKAGINKLFRSVQEDIAENLSIAEVQYVPQTTAYLNNKRWADE